jgi:hypothetical protein
LSPSWPPSVNLGSIIWGSKRKNAVSDVSFEFIAISVFARKLQGLANA